MQNYYIQPLAKDQFNQAVKLVLDAKLDTKEEIEHHLKDLEAHYVAVDEDKKVIGIIGWYQDNVNYASSAMGDKFPGEKAYWVGFFAVAPKFQGQGIGFALINKLREILSSNGIDKIWVSSVPETADYYARQGFKKIMDGEISNNKKVFMVSEF